MERSRESNLFLQIRGHLLNSPFKIMIIHNLQVTKNVTFDKMHLLVIYLAVSIVNFATFSIADNMRGKVIRDVQVRKHLQIQRKLLK